MHTKFPKKGARNLPRGCTFNKRYNLLIGRPNAKLKHTQPFLAQKHITACIDLKREMRAAFRLCGVAN
jgi:hypothetical protein